MKKTLFFAKEIGIFFLALLLGALFTALLELMGVPSSITIVLQMMIVGILFFIMGFLFGRKAEAHGFFEGIKIGFLLLFLLFLLSFLGFDSGFSLSKFIYYVVLLLSSIFGSMLGINTKKEK